MAITNGKVEGLITIPTGGVQALTCEDDNSTAAAITITAGTYYWSSADGGANDFAAQVAADINADADLTDTWTVTISAGEGGTGKCTIAADGATCEVTWQDTDVRDAMGFTGSLTGETSYASTNHVKGLWLPDGPPRSPYGLSDDGADEMDQTYTESSAGHVMTLGYQRKVVQAYVLWQGLSRKKVRIAGESVTGESRQQFVRDVLFAEATYCTDRQLRIYPDADTDGTYTTYRNAAPIPEEEAISDGWIEQWNAGFQRLVVVP